MITLNERSVCQCDTLSVRGRKANVATHTMKQKNVLVILETAAAANACQRAMDTAIVASRDCLDKHAHRLN